jgi:hypothetical protein
MCNELVYWCNDIVFTVEMLIHLDLMYYMLKNYMDAIIWAELCVLGKK